MSNKSLKYALFVYPRLLLYSYQRNSLYSPIIIKHTMSNLIHKELSYIVRGVLIDV